MKIVALPAVILIVGVLAYEQSVHIDGRFTCHGLPAQYAELQLVSKKIIGGDAFARDVFTDPNGYFDIAGYISPSTWSQIDARLYVWHRCSEKPAELPDTCSNWFEIPVPKAFIHRGSLAQRKWRLGEIKLEEQGLHLDSCE